MDLYEFQAKEIFREFGVPTSRGQVAESPADAGRLATLLGGAIVVKAQVLTGGRGKAGGIKVVPDAAAAEQAAAEVLGMEIRGHRVQMVLVEPAVDISQEFYLAATVDRSARRLVLMCSAAGGIDIEEVAARDPGAIARVHVDPLIGYRPFQGRRLAAAVGMPRDVAGAFDTIARGLCAASAARDATLAEINPLALTSGGALVALDAKMTIDDNALFRQPDLAVRMPAGETGAEAQARAVGLSYVHLDGDIGCLVNGAGLAMATMDVIKLNGGEPANFLDIGGGAQAEKVEAAMRIILGDPRVRSVLINIFGGITRGDEVARGILGAMANIDVDVPVVARIVGTNAAEGQAILAGANLETGATLGEAASKAVRLARGEAL